MRVIRRLLVIALFLSACDCERREFERELDALGDEGDRLVQAIALPSFEPERAADIIAPERGLRIIVSMERVTGDESQLIEDAWISPYTPPSWLGGPTEPSPRDRGDPPPELPPGPLRLLELDEGRIPTAAARHRGGMLILPSFTSVGFESGERISAIFADHRVPMRTLRELGNAIQMDSDAFVVRGPGGLSHLPAPSRFAPSTGNCLWRFEDIWEVDAALEATSPEASPSEPVALSPRARSGSAGCAWQLVLALVIRDDGYALHTREGLLTADCAHQRADHRGPPTMSGRDRAQLRQCLRRLRELSPDESHIQIVVLGDTITVGDVVEAWTAALGTEAEPLYDVIYRQAIYPTEG